MTATIQSLKIEVIRNGRVRSFDDMKREIARTFVSVHLGNKSAAARGIGISRDALNRWLRSE